MAALFSTELEDLTTCAVCLETFTRPKVLPCQHSYCYACLVLLGRDKTTVTCPYCQEEHEIPDSGIPGFMDNLLLKNLVGMTLPETENCSDCKERPSVDDCEHCKKKVCSRCLVKHSQLFTECSISLNQLKDNLTTSTSIDKKVKLGTSRKNLELERRIMNGIFRSRAVNELKEVKILLDQAASMDNLMGTMIELYEVFGSAEEKASKVESYCTKLQGKLSASVGVNSLEDTKNDLVDLKTFLRLIEMRDEEFRIAYSQEHGFQHVEFGQAAVSVIGKYKTENILDQITQLVQDSAEVLKYHVTTTCLPRADHVTTTCLPRADHVTTTSLPRADHVDSPSPPPVIADAETQTENRFHEPEEKKLTEDFAGACMEKRSPKATFADRKYVQNQLPGHVDYAGKGGDEVVVIGQGESVKEENTLDYPRGCAYHVERDEILIADLGNGRIMAYRADRTNARVVYADVRDPWDVAVSGDGEYLYIAAIVSLIKVNMDGHHVKTMNEFSFGKFQRCVSVTCSQDYMVVLDSIRQCVIVYNNREEELRCFGHGHLKSPTSVAMLAERKFYVMDSCWDPVVHEFEWSGSHVSCGVACSAGVWGIAVDADGNVCVPGPGSGCIDVCDPQRKWITSINGPGKGRVKVNNPYGLLLTPDGRLVVADSGHHRVLIF